MTHKIPFEKPITDLANRMEESADYETSQRFREFKDYRKESETFDSAITKALNRIGSETGWDEKCKRYAEELNEDAGLSDSDKFYKISEYIEKERPKILNAHDFRNSYSFLMGIGLYNYDFEVFSKKVTPDYQKNLAESIRSDLESMKVEPLDGYNLEEMTLDEYNTAVKILDEEYAKLEEGRK